MNKRLSLSLALLAIFAMGATAQSTPDWVGKPPAMGIGFDEALDQCSDRCTTAASFVAFSAYLITPVRPLINGFEATVTIPVNWTVTNTTTNPSAVVNLCTSPCFIVGLGQTYSGNPHYTLVSFDLLYFAGPNPPTDSLMCVGPSTPSSTPGTPNVVISNVVTTTAPMWYNRPGLLAECALINPTTINCPTNCDVEIATQTSTFGAIKARF
jgi:hypothetical protein